MHLIHRFMDWKYFYKKYLNYMFYSKQQIIKIKNFIAYIEEHIVIPFSKISLFYCKGKFIFL